MRLGDEFHYGPDDVVSAPPGKRTAREPEHLHKPEATKKELGVRS